MKMDPTERRAEQLFTNDQLLGIGKVAAEWAMLEHALGVFGACALELEGRTFRLLTGNPGGASLAAILKEVAVPLLTDRTDAEALNGLLTQIMQLSAERNDIVHGVWTIPAAARGAPIQITPGDATTHVVLKQRGRTFRWQDLTVHDVDALAERIALIRFELNRTMHSLGY